MRVTHEIIKKRLLLGVPLFTPCKEMQKKKRCLTSECGFSFTDDACMFCHVSCVAESIKRKREKHGVK